MSTSQTNTSLCEAVGDEPMDTFTLKYMASHARHLAHEALLEAFQSSGLTKSMLAKRLRWDRSRVSRLLNTPANITVETFGELLFAIDGSSPAFDCKKLLQNRPTNYHLTVSREQENRIRISGINDQQRSFTATTTTRNTVTFNKLTQSENVEQYA